MLNLDIRPNSKEVMKIMNAVIEYNGWQRHPSDRLWQDTELGQPDFSNLFTQLKETDDLEFKNVLYFICEENIHNGIKDISMLCEKAQRAYSLFLKSHILSKELIKNLPGAIIKTYNGLNQYFPNNSVYITEMQYDNKTFYIWVYRYGPHWDERDEFGKIQRKYCALKDYFYKLFLNDMDTLPTGYHIFCPYTSTATDDKRTVNDIFIWDIFKELRTKRIVDLITNKLKYAKWDTTIRKMHPKQSDLSMFLGETVSYMNKGEWNQYVDELKNTPGGFIYPDRGPEMKKLAQDTIKLEFLFERSPRFSNEKVLRDGNLYLVSGIVESFNNAGTKISQEYSVEIQRNEVVYTKIGDRSFGTYIPLNENEI